MTLAAMRRLVSAIACYGFVLQAIFAGAASAAMAGGPNDSVLCITSTSEGHSDHHVPGPGPSDHGACCGAFCCSFAASAVVLADGLLPWIIVHNTDAVLVAMTAQAIGVWPSERPRSSRAPPGWMT